MIKELFEGPVGDYCIARNTIKCLFHKVLLHFIQSPHSDYVTRCYFNLCLQQGSRDDRVSRDAFSFLYV